MILPQLLPGPVEPQVFWFGFPYFRLRNSNQIIRRSIERNGCPNSRQMFLEIRTIRCIYMNAEFRTRIMLKFGRASCWNSDAHRAQMRLRSPFIRLLVFRQAKPRPIYTSKYYVSCQGTLRSANHNQSRTSPIVLHVN